VGRRVVVLGGGATGEAFVAALRRYDAEARVTLVERELIGGECTYWACMPSKTLLRSTEVMAEAKRAPGADMAMTETMDVDRIFWWRDRVVDGYDDAGHVDWLEGLGAEAVRGDARVAAPGRIEIKGGDPLDYDALVLATGSVPALPPIEGLADVDYWTSRDATGAKEVPASLVVLGAGPVGCELAQFYARLGTRVVLVAAADRILERVDAEASELVAAAFAEDGIELRTGARATRVEPGIRIHLDDGAVLEAERLLVATGRRPNVDGLGLDRVGVTVGRRGVVVDERLRAADGVWAIGDVTGIALFTHVGKYQGRVAAANVAGRDTRADYRAIPAAIFTDPQVATVGRTDEDALVTGKWRLPARLSTYELPRRQGFLKLFADPERRVVVGGVAVGPESGEWLQQVTLAVRAEVPVDVLRDVIQPYPTFSEAVYFAARELPV
jgi:pyruvate/2-oxoglutarate dehydrogenase complex dihydrolipoamide dehydrogenase (E3) component